MKKKVKSKESVKARSLYEFRKKFDPEVAVRLSLRNLQCRAGFLDLPLTLADRFLDFM